MTETEKLTPEQEQALQTYRFRLSTGKYSEDDALRSLVRDVVGQVERERDEAIGANVLNKNALAHAQASDRASAELLARMSVEWETKLAASEASAEELRRRVEGLADALRKIAAIRCGIPGHSVAVGCGAADIARAALDEAQKGGPRG